MSKKPTHQEILGLLDYNSDTGEFVWKVRCGPIRAGTRAGNTHPRDGYRRIGIAGKLYQAHRLAWFISFGTWPEIVDHVNRVRDDNRICNLRAATKAQNNANCNLSRNNKSGVNGVYRARHGKPWVADIGFGGKKHRIGAFTTIEEAAEARRVAALKFFGEFAPSEVQS